MEYEPFYGLNKKSRLLVAFSGGIDSAVAAHLCFKADMDVLAVNMRLWGPDPEKTAQKDEQTRRVADALGIELCFLDLQEQFCEKVMRACWNEFASGRTPNPCALCNPMFKFGELLEFARQKNCAGLVTGHYARIVHNADGSAVMLRGTCRAKDQSYFLYGLSQQQLQFSYMPLGAMDKSEVRLLASELGLPNSESPESQDICFAPEDGSTPAEMLRNLFHAEAVKGSFIHASNGKTLGQHDGIHANTVGQRKGTGIALGKPAYVKGIIPERREVLITDDEQTLFEREFTVGNLNFQSETFAEKETFRSDVQIRYRSRPAPAEVRRISAESYRVIFDEPQRAITPGQSAVFYSAEQLLGGGVIL